MTTSALETLLFRARRSLAEELQHQLTCTEAQLAVSQSVDGRLGRKERRRLRDHLAECPDCARFARLQQRHRSALRGLALVPIPLSLTLFKGSRRERFGGRAPHQRRRRRYAVAVGAGASTVAVGAGVGTGATAAGTGGVLASGLGLKVAAVVAAAGVAGGVGVTGSTKVDEKPAKPSRPAAEQPGARLGQVAPRGVTVPGNGVARGKASAPGQTKPGKPGAKQRASAQSQGAKVEPRGQTVSAAKRKAAAERKATKTARASTPTSRPPQATRARGTPPKKAATAPKASSATPKRSEQGQGEWEREPQSQRGRPEGTLSVLSSPPSIEGGSAPGNGRSRSHTCDSSLHSLPCRRLSSSPHPSPPRARHRRRWNAAPRSRPRSSSR